jgi:molybdopterin-guanine dinucleotide biosynthesis protein A
MPISCAILAGGKSRRMGAEKAFLKLGELAIIERVIDTVMQVASEILIVTNDTKNFTHLKTQDIPFDIVKDVYPGVGALGGLHSGLYHAAHEMVFVCACDMPFLNPELIRFITNASTDHDATVPIINNYYEPLIAAYSKNCIKAIEYHIDKGDRQILSFYKDVKLREVTEDELKTVDKDLLSFININRPEDLTRAKQILMEQQR